MMSTDSKKSSDDATMMCCASCGIAAIDDVKLKDCDGGCDLVKYCSDNCQENHRDGHEKECKKRLRDKQLFTMPDGSHLGECPICCLPLPLDPKKSTMMPCCSNWICSGCCYANQMREIEAGLEERCVFCREPAPETDEEGERRILKRIKENNDPVAIRVMGKQLYREGKYEIALEYLTKAAELGDADAHSNLSCIVKDVEKEVYHLEEAAIGGHPGARHDLGCEEAHNRRFERAKKHFIIAAKLGYHDSLKCVKKLYADGNASKEDYAAALRGYQAAVDETKSEERKAAETFYKAKGIIK